MRSKFVATDVSTTREENVRSGPQEQDGMAPASSKPSEIPTGGGRPREEGRTGSNSGLLRVTLLAAAVTALFAVPLRDLVSHALKNELHSHILLIPVVCAYLLYQRRNRLPAPGKPFWTGLLLGATAGVALLAWALLAGRASLGDNDFLAVMTGSYLCVLFGGAFGLMGSAWIRAAAFPVAFLLFMIPLPDRLTVLIENGLMAFSADASHLLFKIVGIPVLRTGQTLEIPGIVLEVARECSGIRSTWVLLITSLLGAHLFLRSRWRQALLVAFVLPLGVARNALRIVFIGWLCTRYGPQMVDSAVHHDGGPVFFGISLVPLFGLLWLLRRWEKVPDQASPQPDAARPSAG